MFALVRVLKSFRVRVHTLEKRPEKLRPVLVSAKAFLLRISLQK